MTVPQRKLLAQDSCKLYVRLENGVEFEATAEDFERFGLVERTAFISKTRGIIVDGLAESTAGKEGGDFHLQRPISLLDVASYATENLADDKSGQLQADVPQHRAGFREASPP